jgi:metal transporter CNNM
MLIWLAIAACVTQSAVFSGLNLAVFSLSRLRLEALAENGDSQAQRVLALRRDANYTLVTILVGNVAINVLLTLLSGSVMAGIAAFFFSTVVITAVGEILPQAYFTRHALPVAAALAPLLRGYRVLLWPVARPVGLLLDRLVGPEGMEWFREAELSTVLQQHARQSDIGRTEATGAVNFLALDDVPVREEGEPLDERTIVTFEFRGNRPVFPPFRRAADDPLLRRLHEPGRKWIVLTDSADVPRLVLNAHHFLRGALFDGDAFDPLAACHYPLVVGDATEPLGGVLRQLTVRPEHADDDVVDEDLILVWTAAEKRVLTGSDILGRLLRGITRGTQHHG